MGARGPARVRLPHVEPMLATAGPLPSGTGWVGEVKWDGARCVAYVPEAAPVRLVGRRGGDFTGRFPEVADAFTEVRGPLILDGELVVVRDGTPSFAALRDRIHRTRPAALGRAAGEPAVFIAFDLLHTGGRPLLAEPYARRRAALDGLQLERPHLRVSPVWNDIAEAYGWTREHRLKGVIAKRNDSRYAPGARSRDWVKVEHLRVADVVIGGWLPGGPGEASVRAVLVGVPAERDGPLRFVGTVGTGFAAPERRALAAVLRRIACPVSPFSAGAGLGLPRGTVVRFTRPELRAEVEFLEHTDAGRLRQPVWRGLR
ncbi:ATP-dependent DNA ligase [Kitasatospora sp. A2-31]|uniref:ATP-dependent DNA ligase n=1 Tax=Kitasatospora sp. A2-31 TaxID=2916414 RepID=UPI001EEBD830|nr:ATP-dependent DNA ligase [Kitasatospora sp. A2-31]MCG6494308.1 ATP-dependent DNA ligase [Kitasatospora sp. A2-31]